MKWRRTGFIDEGQVEQLPDWLSPIVDATRFVTTDDLTRFAPTDGQGRGAAVLVLFGDGPDVLIIERARGDVAHSGQPAFPVALASTTTTMNSPPPCEKRRRKPVFNRTECRFSERYLTCGCR